MQHFKEFSSYVIYQLQCLLLNSKLIKRCISKATRLVCVRVALCAGSTWNIKVNILFCVSVDDHETDFEYEGSDNDEEDHNEGDPRSVADMDWSDLIV